jgi:galactokinase
MIPAISKYLEFLQAPGKAEALLATLYGPGDQTSQRARCMELLQRQQQRFGVSDALLISSPGRTELGGNHTDHNHGRVLAAAVNLDCLAAISPNGEERITLSSAGFPAEIEIDIGDSQLHPDEHGRAEALIRGVAAAFRQRGHAVGGFDACLHATCRPGTGLSSSAAFSVLIGAAFNFLFNENRLTATELALIGQFAENRYFGKPCGLMDQLASAAGHILHIDFNDPAQPIIERIDSSPFAADYRLAVVDTGGSHVGLTPEYAAIPQEMFAAAAALGRPFARGLSLDDVRRHLPGLRQTVGDRAILRLMHFILENDRVEAMARALCENDTAGYLQLVRASGDSSWRLLQNCTSSTSIAAQGVALALVLTESFLDSGAWRVQGGGFAGTIQVYVPRPRFAEYQEYIEGFFGAGSLIELHVGRPGVCALLPDGRLQSAG